MYGQLVTSFRNSVAMGSYQAQASTVPNLCEELRYSSGAAGSVSIGTAYTKDNVTIATGWYNFLWIPHRSGGVNGAASGDNCNYGSLYLSGMTVWNVAYLLRFSTSTITELHDLYAPNLLSSRTLLDNRLTSANQDFGNGKLAYFHATSTMTTGKPSWGDGHILHLGWDNTHPNWSSQLYIQNGGYNAAMRFYSGNDQTWKDWKRLWTEDTAPMNSIVDITVASSATDASGSWVDHKTYSFAAGTWIIQYSARWGANATGRRCICASPNVPTGYPGWGNGVSAMAVSGTQTVLNITRVVRFTSATTIHFATYQNSGSSLEVNAGAKCVRLCV